MKKNSLRLSAVVLACVPLLLGGVTPAHAEAENTTTSSSVMTSEKAVDNNTTSQENETTKESTSETKEVFLKLETKKISGKKGESSPTKIKLAKVDNTVLKGEFKSFNNTFIEVDKDGIWKAKAKTEKKDETIQLEFVADLGDPSTKNALSKAYPSISLDDTKKITIKTEKIAVNFTDVDKPIDPTKDKAVLPITVANKKDKLVVSVKDSELKATFTAVKNDKIDLKSDGTFTIPDKNKDVKFTEKVTLNLDTTDANYKKIAESAEYEGKDIQTEYKNLDAAITRPAAKVINLTYTVKELAAKINGGGTLAFNDVDSVKITGTFKEIKDNEFISLDEKGNWKAKKAGKGSIDPTFTISKESLTDLQKKYPEQDLKIETSSLKVNFTESGSGSGSGSNQKQYAPVNKKQYAPVKKLPQTGEEKMRFAGIIGIVVLVIVGLVFFLKKKKNNDETDENNN